MKIVFFDGYCSLCNHFVDWIIRIDQTGEIKFASLQGETASRILGSSIDVTDLDTVIYVCGDQKYERSTAVLMILSDLGGAWRISRVFLAVPRVVRDFIYQCVARNRYRLFKKRDSCRMPSPDERARILP